MIYLPEIQYSALPWYQTWDEGCYCQDELLQASQCGQGSLMDLAVETLPSWLHYQGIGFLLSHTLKTISITVGYHTYTLPLWWFLKVGKYWAAVESSGTLEANSRQHQFNSDQGHGGLNILETELERNKGKRKAVYLCSIIFWSFDK